jgi:hypothetical protein
MRRHLASTRRLWQRSLANRYLCRQERASRAANTSPGSRREAPQSITEVEEEDHSPT